MFGSFAASWRDHRLPLVVFGSRFNLGFVCFILFFVVFSVLASKMLHSSHE